MIGRTTSDLALPVEMASQHFPQHIGGGEASSDCSLAHRSQLNADKRGTLLEKSLPRSEKEGERESRGSFLRQIIITAATDKEGFPLSFAVFCEILAFRSGLGDKVRSQ